MIINKNNKKIFSFFSVWIIVSRFEDVNRQLCFCLLITNIPSIGKRIVCLYFPLIVNNPAGTHWQWQVPVMPGAIVGRGSVAGIGPLLNPLWLDLVPHSPRLTEQD